MITNKINGKRYIGKSVRIEKRFSEHRLAKTDMAISKAIREYGADSFCFEILELCSKDMLDERESYWIDYYNTYSGYGYNAAPGGEGAPHKVKLSDEDVLRVCEDIANTDHTLRQIAKKYNVSNKTISDINYGHSRSNITSMYYTFPIRGSFKNQTGINSIDELNKLLEENNNSVSAVAKLIGCSNQCIYGWIRRGKTGCYDNSEKVKHNGLKQIDIDSGNVIGIFSSASKAAQALGVNSSGSIHCAASGNCKTAYGYRWEYI